MNDLFGTFGVMAFIAFMVVIWILGREFLKLKKENTQLHQELEAIMQIVPTLSPDELNKINPEKINETEEIEECPKS